MARPPTPEPERFWKYVRVDVQTGCWNWAGKCDPRGDGRFRLGREHGFKTIMAHRFLMPPVSPGREIDHLCYNPSCVRPDHLEEVTHQENTRRRSAHYKKPHCSKGHLYTEETLLPQRDGSRKCRICVRAYNQSRKVTHGI